MPVSTECPSCQARLSVEDSILGQSVQCPNCGNAFTAVTQEAISPRGASPGNQREAPHHHPPVSAVGPSDDDHELDIRPGGPTGNWWKARAGLILILVCTIVALVIWGLVGLITLRIAETITSVPNL